VLLLLLLGCGIPERDREHADGEDEDLVQHGLGGTGWLDLTAAEEDARVEEWAEHARRPCPRCRLWTWKRSGYQETKTQ